MVAVFALAAAWFFLADADGTETSGESSAVTATHGQPATALLDEVVFTRETSKGQLAELIASGSHQLTGQNISDVTTFRRVRSSDALAYDISYGSSIELTLNVAGPAFVDGTINPFHHQAFREAINWLVDRRHIVEEIYGGLAVPRFLPINTAFPDSARLAETVRQLELKYGYQPEKARAVMAQVLSNLGATRVDGKWHHNGKPLVVKVLIRIEDQRQIVGDYVADMFQDLGFEVERLYRSASESSRLWLSGNPALGEWHIYTGGWGATLINRDLAASFDYFYTPRGRPGGLWQRYEPAPEFDEVSARLARRQYGSWAERQALMRQALKLAMQDSARIWLIDEVAAWVRSPDVTLAVDLAAGPVGAQLWPYTLRYNNQQGGQIKVALPALLAEPFNPIAGSNWSVDNMVIRGLQDQPVLPDPFTGLYRAQQIKSAAVTVKTGFTVNSTLDWVTLNEADEIDVPGDTWIDWDHKGARWITVAEKYPQGLSTNLRVRIEYPDDFLQRRWQDGSTRSLADMVLPWILTFERANPASPLYDTAHIPAFTLFQKDFHGRRIVSTDPLVVEFYGGPILPDAESIVALRSPGFGGASGVADMNVPWHTLGLAIRSEIQGELALSSTKADLKRVEWTNFVDGPSLEIFRRHLEQASNSAYLPYANTLKDLISPGEIASRYERLNAWSRQRSHFWVGDGPYYLHAVHAVEGSLVLRPSPYYEEPVDKWLRFTKPRIPAFDIAGPMITRLGETANFDINIRFDGKPYPQADIDVVAYMVFDKLGEMRAAGEADFKTEGVWQVNLDEQQLARLGIGGNRLEIAVTATPVALPTFGTHGFATVPGNSSLPDAQSVAVVE